MRSSPPGPPASDAALDTLRRFAAAMAHEINNPLGALVMNAEVASLLVDRGRLDELPAVLRQIQTDAKRCAAQVRNMTDVAGSARQATTSIELPVLLDAVRSRMCQRLARSVESIPLDAPPSLPRVLGNVDAIEYAVYQLARQVFASGVDRPGFTVVLHGERVCLSIAASEPPLVALPDDGRVSLPPRFAHDEAVLDVTRCLLAGSHAELFVTSHAGKLAYHVLFERAGD